MIYVLAVLLGAVVGFLMFLLAVKLLTIDSKNNDIKLKNKAVIKGWSKDSTADIVDAGLRVREVNRLAQNKVLIKPEIAKYDISKIRKNKEKLRGHK